MDMFGMMGGMMENMVSIFRDSWYSLTCFPRSRSSMFLGYKAPSMEILCVQKKYILELKFCDPATTLSKAKTQHEFSG